MRYHVVALENEAYRVVAVCIPIPVLVLLGGTPVYHEVSGGVLIQTADDVQQRGLAAARMSEHRDKLAVAETYRHVAQSVNFIAARIVVLCYVFDLKHLSVLLSDKTALEIAFTNLP